MLVLRGRFRRRLVGNMLGGPDLAVGMRIAGAHHGAAVLEDLHVLDIGSRQRGRLAGPGIHHAAISGWVIRARVSEWSGWKQSTRQSPRAGSATSSGEAVGASGESGSSAA